MVANPARGQLNREIEVSLSPFAPEGVVSRDMFGRPVQVYQVKHCRNSPGSGVQIYKFNTSKPYQIPRRRGKIESKCSMFLQKEYCAVVPRLGSLSDASL